MGRGVLLPSNQGKGSDSVDKLILMSCMFVPFFLHPGCLGHGYFVHSEEKVFLIWSLTEAVITQKQNNSILTNSFQGFKYSRIEFRFIGRPRLISPTLFQIVKLLVYPIPHLQTDPRSRPEP